MSFHPHETYVVAPVELEMKMIVKLKCQIQVNQNVSKFYRVKNDFPYHQYKMRLVFFVVFICNRNLLNFFNSENALKCVFFLFSFPHLWFCNILQQEKILSQNRNKIHSLYVLLEIKRQNELLKIFSLQKIKMFDYMIIQNALEFDLMF